MSDLFCNIDCNCFFISPLRGRPGNTGEAIDHYVDYLAEAGVTVLVVNTNARRTNYRSKVWDAWWDGYDRNGPDTQPFLKAVPEDRLSQFRRYMDMMLALYESGVDYPERMLAGAHRHGMRGWISLRMNDTHHAEIVNHPFHGSFWREHPEFQAQGWGGWYKTVLNYARPEVRDYFRALITETLDRYDIDGLELDFMREPYLFDKGAENAGRGLLTDWLEDIHALTSEAASRRRHPVGLGVRVPSHPDTAFRMGFDVIEWAGRGFVDLVVPTPRLKTIEYDMPLEEWRTLLDGAGTTLLGGLQAWLTNSPQDARTGVKFATTEHATGGAAAVLNAGADGVYLFNYFPVQHPPWSATEYVETLRQMTDLSALARRPRRHAVTYRDIVASDEHYTPRLPAFAQTNGFSLNTGPLPPKGYSVTLELKIEMESERRPPAVAVNGVGCKYLQKAGASDRKTDCVVYCVPVDSLGSGTQNILVKAEDDDAIKITGVEMRMTD